MAAFPGKSFVFRFLKFSGFTGYWLWGWGVLHYGPRWSGSAHIVAEIFWVLFPAVFFTKNTGLRSLRRWGAVFLLFPLLIWWQLQPGRIAEYRSEQSRLPWAEIADSGVVLHDLRCFRYPGKTEILPRWCNRKLNLDSLETLDFLIVYFAGWRGIAHTMLSFGWSNGQHVVLSIEARRASGEPYALLPGLFRRFELMYVLGDEGDLLDLRLKRQGDPVYRLPIHTPVEKIRGLFLNILETANELRIHPRNYNTLTTTCTNQLAVLANPLRKEPIKLWDYRLLLPGFSPILLQELDFLEEKEPILEVLEKYREPAATGSR